MNTVSTPLVRYHGGKWRLAPWIIGHFPPHRTYVEVFGGGAGVLLRKRPSPVEVYNDLDGDVVNFFRVLREHPEELARAVEMTPYARAELDAAWEAVADPLERARRFAVRAWMSIGGPSDPWKSGLRYRRTDTSQPVLQWKRLPESLMSAASRLKSVLIEQADYRRVLNRYDAPDTLFYCDPPYLPAVRLRRRAYRCEFDENDHRALAEALAEVQGMVVLSGYAHPLYTELYEERGWERYDMPTVNQNGARAMESLWLNPAARRRERQLSLWPAAETHIEEAP